ncbi:MAG TPA: hypothetical protein VGN17_22480 [Bryobacteraceae bacterium]|jgi:hypothetical protein
MARRSAGWKVMLGVALLFAAVAAADEASERVVIGRVITQLNRVPMGDIFTGDATSELDRLPEVKTRTSQIMGLQLDSVYPPEPGPIAVTISREPWGEATVNFPGLPTLVGTETTNPRISAGEIRFITPDVAIADGTWTYRDETSSTSLPLLLVMKKEGESWKIASLRVLTPR